MSRLINQIFLSLVICLLIASTAQAGFLNNTKKAEVNSRINSIASGTYPTEPRDINTIIANIIKVILSFLGIIFVVLIVISGANWMTAHGNEEKVSKAKETLLNLVIGLILVLAAFVITFLISNALSSKLLK